MSISIAYVIIASIVTPSIALQTSKIAQQLAHVADAIEPCGAFESQSQCPAVRCSWTDSPGKCTANYELRTRGTSVCGFYANHTIRDQISTGEPWYAHWDQISGYYSQGTQTISQCKSTCDSYGWCRGIAFPNCRLLAPSDKAPPSLDGFYWYNQFSTIWVEPFLWRERQTQNAEIFSCYSKPCESFENQNECPAGQCSWDDGTCKVTCAMFACNPLGKATMNGNSTIYTEANCCKSVPCETKLSCVQSGIDKAECVSGFCRTRSETEVQEKRVKDEVRRDFEDYMVTHNELCKRVKVNMTQIGSPNYLGANLPWPNSTNSDAYAAISKCLTMVPTCNPHRLNEQGIADVRRTFIDASHSSGVLQSYMDILENSLLMASVFEHSNCTDRQGYDDTLLQITTEVTLLRSLATYFDNVQDLLTRLGASFQVALQMNLQALVESSVEATTVTTTTTTTTVNKQIKTLLKVIDVSMDVLGTVGAVLAPFDATVAVGATFVAIQVVEGQIQSTTAFIKNMNESSSSAADSAAEAEANAGIADDSLADSNELFVLIFIQNVVKQWQTGLNHQRSLIASNWGRLLAAAPVFKSCPLSEEVVQTAIDISSPVLDWFALSALMPAKYVIYTQRNYAMQVRVNYINQPNCYDFISLCKQLPAGCFSIKGAIMGPNSKMLYKDLFTNIFLPGAADNTVDVEYGDAFKFFWVGEVGNPTAGPPASFWNFVLRENGGFAKYVLKQFPIAEEKEKIYQRKAYHGGTVGDSWSLSYVDYLLDQCTFVPKTYVASGGLTIEEQYGGPSAHETVCDVFGAPWLVNTFLDCDAHYTMNGYYCSSSQSSECSFPVANFNAFIYLPKQPHKYSDPGSRVIGCCGIAVETCFDGRRYGANTATEYQEADNAEDNYQPDCEDCELPVCDCATLAAAYWTGQISNYMPTLEHSFWWASCPEIYKTAGWESSLTHENDYLMTSLGFTWPQLYTMGPEVAALKQKLKTMGWTGKYETSSDSGTTTGMPNDDFSCKSWCKKDGCTTVPEQCGGCSFCKGSSVTADKMDAILKELKNFKSLQTPPTPQNLNRQATGHDGIMFHPEAKNMEVNP